MNKTIFLLFFFFSNTFLEADFYNLHTDINAEPNSIVEGVNVISGAFLMHEVDISVDRGVPLTFERTYNSQLVTGSTVGVGFGNNHTSFLPEKWNINALDDGENFRFDFFSKRMSMNVWDKYGSIIRFSGVLAAPGEPNLKCEYYRMAGHGMTNCGLGEISGRTNIKNSYIRTENSNLRTAWDWLEKGFSLVASTNEIKTYTFKMLAKKHKITSGISSTEIYSHYPLIRIRKEERPDQSRINYKYETTKKSDFSTYYAFEKISGKTPDGKTATTLKFKTVQKQKRSISNKPKNDTLIEVTANNKKKASYRIRTTFNQPLLQEVVTSEKLPSTYHYTKIKGAYRLSATRPKGKKGISLSYDDKVRVTELRQARAGTTEMIPAYRFEYDEGLTKVTDAEGFEKHYHHNDNKWLTQVDTLTAESQLYRKQIFSWGDKERIGNVDCYGQLLEKSITDAEDNLLHSTRYFYDYKGNIAEEVLEGDLTGTGECSTYSMKRSYFRKKNLKAEEIQPNGLKTKYNYAANTDLISDKSTYDQDTIIKRELFIYDQNLLTEHYIDNRNHPTEIATNKGVTHRWINRTQYNQNNLPAEVTEFHVDLLSGQEKQSKRTLYEYDECDRITKEGIYDANNRLRYSLIYGYDEWSNVNRKTDAIGRTFYYTYDGLKNKTSEKLAKSLKRYAYTYDEANRLIKTEEIYTSGEQFSQRQVYNYKNQVIESNDIYGNTTKHERDFLGRITKTTLPPIATSEGFLSPEEWFEYNELDQCTAKKDTCGNRIEMRYTIRNDPSLTIYPDGTYEQWEYDLEGNLVLQRGRNGCTTTYTYDILNRPLTISTYDSQGSFIKQISHTYDAFHLTSTTDPLGFTTHFSYNSAGQKIQEIQETETASKRTTYEYDPLGRLKTTKNWLDEKNYVAYHKKFDNAERLIETRTEDAAGTILEKNLYKYDHYDNLTLETVYLTDAPPSTTSFVYNERSELISQTDAAGHTTHYTYNHQALNEYGQLVLIKTTTDPFGIQTIETHNALGDLVSIERKSTLNERLSYQENVYNPLRQKIQEIHANIEGKTNYTISYTYNTQGQVLSQTEQNTKTTLFTYNDIGELATITKPSGTVLCHTYDSLGRLATLTSSDNTVAYNYTYDILDNPIQITDEIRGTHHKRTYNSSGELIEEALPNNLSTCYDYDTIGRVTQVTLPDQSGIAYHYGAVDLLSVTRIGIANSYTHTYSKTDMQGNTLQSTLIDGSSLELTYDPLQRIRSINHSLFSQSIPEGGYDASGNLLSLTTQQEEATFSYNERYQLTEETGLFSHTYTCDSLDNRLQKDNAPYTLNEYNQILSTEKETFHYDPDGNLIQKGNTLYTYDALNRLTTLETSSTKLTYTYDSFGRRTSKSTPGETFTYLYQLSREIGVYQNQTPLALRCLGRGKRGEIGAAIAIELEGTPYAPLHGYRGSVVALIDLHTKQPLETYHYSAFGELQQQPTSPNPWLFLSQHYEPETGLLYFGQRYYDASLGRWLTTDPAGYEDGPNLYAYVHHSPLIYYDLDGLFSLGLPDETSHIKKYEFDICGNSNFLLRNFEKGCHITDDGWSRCISLNTLSNYDWGHDQYLPEMRYAKITFENGIWTSLSRCMSHMQNLSKLSGGYNVHGVYNANHDGKLEECLLGLFGLTTTPAMRLTTLWYSHFQRLELNGHLHKAYIYHECTSQGAIHTRNALRMMPEKYRQRIIVTAIAPAAYIPSDLCKEVNHYRSTSDPVPWFDFFGKLFNRKTTHTLKPHPNATGIDHDYQSDTYLSRREKHINEFKAKYGEIK